MRVMLQAASPQSDGDDQYNPAWVNCTAPIKCWVSFQIDELVVQSFSPETRFDPARVCLRLGLTGFSFLVK